MDGGLALELTAELATTAAEETRLRGASHLALRRHARIDGDRRSQ
jgi:Zn-dependent M28 family amino/carboxypeptidase